MNMMLFSRIIVFIVVLIMICLIRSPLYLSAFYIIFRPLLQPLATEHYVFIGGLPLLSVFPLTLIIVSFIICIVRKDYTILAPNMVFPYLLIFFSACSFYNTSNYIISFGFLFKVITAYALYLLVYGAVMTIEDAKKVLYVIVLSSIIPMLIGFYQFAFSEGFKGSARITGGSGWPNMYGILLSLCFSATLMLLLQAKSRINKWLFTGIIASLVISSVLALNRGTWIALSFALLVSYMAYWRKIKARWLVIAGILVSVCFSGIILQRFKKLEEKGSNRWQINTFERRVNLWKYYVKLIPEHPIIGHGLGVSEVMPSGVPHNDYVRLLFEVGVPGLVFYLIFLSKELLRNIALVRDKRNWFINFPMLLAIVYWVVISSSQNIIHSVTAFPIFLSLLAVSRRWNELSAVKKKDQD